MAVIANKASEKQGSTEKDKEVISKKTEGVPKKKNDTAESLNQKKRYVCDLIRIMDCYLVQKEFYQNPAGRGTN